MGTPVITAGKGMLKNNKRKMNETHPDLSGSCEINDVKYWMAGWKKPDGSIGIAFNAMTEEQANWRPRQAEQRAENKFQNRSRDPRPQEFRPPPAPQHRPDGAMDNPPPTEDSTPADDDIPF
jgi:hypothetical protein